jgi:protein TonB
MAARKGRQLPQIRSGEDLLFTLFVVISATLHLTFALVEDFSWFTDSAPIIEEWAIDAEIVTDIDIGAPRESAMPDSQKAKEAKAPEDILPQLPKKFAIQDTPKPEDMVAEDDMKDPTKNTDKPEEPKKKPVKQDVEMQAEKDEQNRLKKDEALKRLMAEKLRQQKKTAKTFEAEDDDPKARLANLVLQNKKLNTGVFSGRASATAQRYGSRIKLAITRNYTLPSVYNYRDQKLSVNVAVVVSENGSLRSLDVSQSSGEPAFDEFVVEAVKSSAPLPAPPKELAGKQIVLSFTPGSF